MPANRSRESASPNALFTPSLIVATVSPAQLVERQAQVMSLPRFAQRFCEKLTKETGESSSFNVQVDHMSERICGANSNQSLTFNKPSEKRHFFMRFRVEK